MKRAEASKATKTVIATTVIGIVAAFTGWQEWSYRERESVRIEGAMIVEKARRFMECERIVSIGPSDMPDIDGGQSEDAANAILNSCRDFLKTYP